MLQIFQETPERPNIFEAFEYMDGREDWLISERTKAAMYPHHYYYAYGSYGWPYGQKGQKEPHGQMGKEEEKDWKTRGYFKG